jgi:hypothetical protein
MAAAVLLSSQKLSNSPFLIKKYVLTAGTDGLEITHGETVSPDICICTNMTTNPTATEVSCVRTSATATTVDFEAAAGTFHVFMIWLPMSSGGIS